jgi:hypothetical protein
MARSLLGFDIKEAPGSARGGGFFLWTVVLLLLTGAAIASWIGSFYIVAHPEQPRSYRLLTKLKKLDPPKHFPVTEGPSGRFLSPKQLVEGFSKAKAEDMLAGFGKMGPVDLAQKNAELLRMYIKNYKETKRAVPYVSGVFEVVEAFELTGNDFFPSGVVAVTQAKDYPQMLLEFVFPATASSTNTIKNFLPVGREITLERSRDLAAVVHVERLSDSRMLFTAVPLSYGSFQLKEGRGSFTLRSPEDLMDPKKGGVLKSPLNITAPLPIVNGIRLQKSLATHADYRRKVMATAETERPATNQIVGFRSGVIGEEQPVEIATPVVLREAQRPPAPPQNPPPAAPQRASTSITPPTPTRPPLISSTAALPERFPLAPRPIVRAAAPAPSPAVEAPPEPEPAPPKPVVISRPPAPPEPSIPVAVPIVKPVETPPVPSAKGRVVSIKGASAMVDGFDPTSGVVLEGEFVVTGVLGQRVALRSRDALRDPDADPAKPGTSGAMIVVDFPKGVLPPAKDSSFSRDAAHGFLIKSVRRGQNGHITVLAEDRSEN